MSNPFTSELQRINSYNFDNLLKVVTEWNEPEQVRRDLLDIYFHAAQAVFNDGSSIGTLADSFSTLQAVIEALDMVGNIKDAKFAVINK